MNLVIIAGIKRSFSTGMYNLVRLALKMAGYTVNICDDAYKIREVPDNEVDIVKIHVFREDIAQAADHIFLTDRNDQGIKESWENFYGSKLTDDKLARLRLTLSNWQVYSDIQIFNYQLWQHNKISYINRVVDVLELDIEANIILNEFQDITLPKKGQDHQTLFFHNHISR